MELHARLAPDASAARGPYVHFRFNLPDGGNVSQTRVGAVTSSWQPTMLSAEAPASTSEVVLNVGIDSDPGGCLDIDDVSVVGP